MDARKVEEDYGSDFCHDCVFVIFREWDWQTVGIYAGSNMPGRLLYPFFHTNMFHAFAQFMVFIIDYFYLRYWDRKIAVSLYDCRYSSSWYPWIFHDNGFANGVGLSGLVFALFGSISFEALRKRYYQLWMLFYLVAGFVSGHKCRIASLVLCIGTHHGSATSLLKSCTMKDKTIKDILTENERRNAIVYAKFNPITGEGSVGKRVKCTISDFPIHTQWLPNVSWKCRLYANSLEAGSISKPSRTTWA